MRSVPAVYPSDDGLAQVRQRDLAESAFVGAPFPEAASALRELCQGASCETLSAPQPQHPTALSLSLPPPFPPPHLPPDLTKRCIYARTQYLSLVVGLALFFLVVRNKKLPSFIR